MITQNFIGVKAHGLLIALSGPLMNDEEVSSMYTFSLFFSRADALAGSIRRFNCGGLGAEILGPDSDFAGLSTFTIISGLSESLFLPQPSACLLTLESTLFLSDCCSTCPMLFNLVLSSRCLRIPKVSSTGSWKGLMGLNGAILGGGEEGVSLAKGAKAMAKGENTGIGADAGASGTSSGKKAKLKAEGVVDALDPVELFLSYLVVRDILGLLIETGFGRGRP